MNDVSIRTANKAGRITLQRPEALNALTHQMCLSIKNALDKWRSDHSVEIVVIDAVGSRAFCAGGDIVDMYRCGQNGDFAYGQQYWRDEYHLNVTIDEYPKPIVSFLQGFVMGGGVGIGCHGTHRIVSSSSCVAMPECSIGLIPDVGGSYLLANGPGRIGEYLGVTGTRMNSVDAIFMGFADHLIEESNWADIKSEIYKTGSIEAVIEASTIPPSSILANQEHTINRLFQTSSLVELIDVLELEDSDFASKCLNRMRKNSPLSMACTLELISRQRSSPTIRYALSLEYRFVHRSLEKADFLEGIRAKIIDKDGEPAWQHQDWRHVSDDEVRLMLAPLGKNELGWQ